jgi:hypothetical protein
VTITSQASLYPNLFDFPFWRCKNATHDVGAWRRRIPCRNLSPPGGGMKDFNARAFSSARAFFIVPG